MGLSAYGELKFRQRVAWVALGTYLCLTLYFIYYIFDASEAFNRLALEHRRMYHSDKNTVTIVDDRWFLRRAADHITDIPLPLLILLVVLPYLQVFAMLLACTRSDPRTSMAIRWPLQLARVCSLHRGRTSEEDTLTMKEVLSRDGMNGSEEAGKEFHEHSKDTDLLLDKR